MLLFQWTTLALFAFMQVAAVPPFTDGILDAKEKERMARTTNIEQRIKVYEAAAKRIHQSLQAAVAADDFSTFPDIFKTWDTLLSGSLEDIEANLRTKKKSRALIRYEIQARKSITDFQTYKTIVPVEQQEMLNTSLAQSEKIRKRFVEIIFKQ